MRLAVASALQKIPARTGSLADRRQARPPTPKTTPTHNSAAHVLVRHPAGRAEASEGGPRAARQATKIDRVRTASSAAPDRPGVGLTGRLRPLVDLLAGDEDDAERKGISSAASGYALAGRRDVTAAGRLGGRLRRCSPAPDGRARERRRARWPCEFGDAEGRRRPAARSTDAKAPADARRTALERLVGPKAGGPRPGRCTGCSPTRRCVGRRSAAWPRTRTPTPRPPSSRRTRRSPPPRRPTPCRRWRAAPAFARGPARRRRSRAPCRRRTCRRSPPGKSWPSRTRRCRRSSKRAWGTVRPASADAGRPGRRSTRTCSPRTPSRPPTRRTAGHVFAKNCAACHKLFGDGGDVGPELTGSQRANLDYVLGKRPRPVCRGRREYLVTVFNLANGRTLTGIVKAETDQAVTVRTLNETVVVAKDDIEGRNVSKLSIMPEGMFDKLKDDEVRDLVAYLRESRPRCRCRRPPRRPAREPRRRCGPPARGRKRIRFLDDRCPRPRRGRGSRGHRVRRDSAAR